ncbi:MAG: hypothetical protein OHK0038_08480 [Flammeovirgaceae bacterium]
MKKHFIRLFIYNDWANKRYFDFLKNIPSSEIPERIQLLASHVITAQKLWLTRILGNPDLSIHIWKPLPWQTLEEMSAENTRSWINYLQNSDEQEFERILSYENFQKIHYENFVSDIIMQCINHATYHRAQYAILLRQANITPPNTDFITFAREYKSERII